MISKWRPSEAEAQALQKLTDRLGQKVEVGVYVANPKADPSFDVGVTWAGKFVSQASFSLSEATKLLIEELQRKAKLWQAGIEENGTPYQKDRLASLSSQYPLYHCQQIMAAESVGDRAYQAALKAAKERKK